MTKPMLADRIEYTPDMDIYDIHGNKKEATYLATIVDIRYFEKSVERVGDRAITLDEGWYFVRKGDSALMGVAINKFYSTLESSQAARDTVRKQELARQIAILQQEMETL